MTHDEMLEYLVKWMLFRYEVVTTPDEIWHYSPTGELAMVFMWADEMSRDIEFLKTLPAEDQSTISIFCRLAP